MESYTGKTDLKRHLMDGRAAGASILHISTHAAVDTMDPNRSRILFSREDKKVGSEYLFLQEVHGINLRGIDLVTLSACDTESGKNAPGEGVQSFSRAFLGAGAAATVTTLWRVADHPTAEFMKQFYFHLARGGSKAAALREAKLSFLRSGSELAKPRYWAAFVLNGDGRKPIPLTVSWISIAVSLVVAAFLAIVPLRLLFLKMLRLKRAGRNGHDRQR
jgi:CHAT domain-containing protein